MDRGVRFVMELLRATGETIGQVPLEPDWEPAIEWTRLAGLRARGVWAPAAAAERGVEPVWHATLGEPHVGAFRVHLAASNGETWHEDFPLAYVQSRARAESARLVDRGVLESGESFLYRVVAHAARPSGRGATGSALTAEDTPPPLTLVDSAIQPFMTASVPAHGAAVDPFPVFVPQAVLEEATSLTIAAGEAETGGFLIGRLHRMTDPGPRGAARDIFIEVTALVPARHTVGSATRLTFTADTWTDARACLALRRRGEQLLGWFHSHPQFAWCAAKGCSPEAQRTCSRAAGFLSEDDGLLHRMMFPRAFTVALLVTHTVAGCVPALFGWQHGMLAARGFRVLSPEPSKGTLNVSSHEH